MTRFVDIILYADGSNGPLGAPLKCVEHEDEARALPSGATRMTTEEYRAQQKAWDAEWARWWAERPPEPPPPPPPPPEALPAWACKAALEETEMLGMLKALLADAPPALRWRFEAAATWHRADIEAMGDRFGVPASTRAALWARAAEIAER
jgi:hypothetical protein